MKKKYYIYLIYLSVVTLVVTVVSVSRYSSTVEGGGSAVVAVPVIEYIPVSATFNGDPLTGVTGGGLVISGFQPGDELVYHFNISNHDGTRQNQVLLKYDISVSFDPDPQVIPLTYTISPAAIYQSQGEWTYLGFNGHETHSYTLTVLWNDNQYGTSHLNQEQLIEIKIDSEQADSLE
ncbi:MAG: hypothetical protein PHE79_10605 [Eubacteriales bacterium]|nr:hypothetical protein [Eubacteriales bacterium]